ncbi:MAG: 4-hydroxy-tetrahydrodipicolinate synthase [Sumerlaeia bacterium]
MLKAKDLRGCYPALITPMMEEEGQIVVDIDKFHQVIAQVVDAGVSGVLIAGTTGQSATLTHEEHVKVVVEGAIYARGYAAGQGREIQIIASAGSNSTHEALDLSRRILLEGKVDALLHVTGYYNNPPQEGLLAHYKKVADVAAEFESSVILYNVPSRTNSNIEAATAIELAKHPAIIGVKEASGNIEQIKQILDGTDREQFAVVSGEDHMVADIIAMGGQGVISATANVWPGEFQTLCNLALAGEMDKARELQEALMPCVQATFSVKNPIPLHHILDSKIRLPLVTMDQLEDEKRRMALEKIDKALAIKSFPHVGDVAGPRTLA